MITEKDIEVIKKYCLDNKLCKRFKNDNILISTKAIWYKYNGKYRLLPELSEMMIKPINN